MHFLANSNQSLFNLYQYFGFPGAGVLVTTVTTACVALAKPFRTQRRPIVKDIVFYIIAIVWNFSIMFKGFIHLAEALGKFYSAFKTL